MWRTTGTRRTFTRLSHESTCAHTQSKVNQNDDDKTNADNSGTPALIVDALDVAALPDLVYAPDIQEETVDQGAGGEKGESPGGDEGCVVCTEVEECCSDTA